MKKKDSQQKIKRGIWRIICFVSFAFLLLLFPAPNFYFQSIDKTGGIYLGESLNLPTPPLYPQSLGTSLPDVSAAGIYIVDIPSNVVLFEKNSKLRFLPASTAKIATALVVLDYYKLDDVLTIKTVLTDGRKMGLVPDEQITVESLLYGTLVHSANDAAYALAENYPGGVSNFVAMMNNKVSSLHLTDTHFTNPVGYDDSDNYTTPEDLEKLAKAAITNKVFAKIISTKSITVSDENFTYFHPLSNVNELLGKVAGVAGVKTGFTDSAGEILVSEVRKNGKSILIVVLKSRDRFQDTVKLIDWVFSGFVWKNIAQVTPAIQVK